VRFKGKTIVVTGGGSGIGAQIAKDLYAEGANVCILGRTATKLEDVKQEVQRTLPSLGVFLAYRCDISASQQVVEIFSALRTEGLRTFGLVNSAAVNPSRHTISDTSLEDWEKTIATNLTGAFNCTKTAIQDMLENGGGSIVNIGSIAGITALPERASYMASKWGLVGLTKSTAVDFASKNVRVNCVCPGYAETPLVGDYLSNLNPDERERLTRAHPLRGLGRSQDISQAVLFLLSDDASWITGAVLPVDGGFAAGRES